MERFVLFVGWEGFNDLEILGCETALSLGWALEEPFFGGSFAEVGRFAEGGAVTLRAETCLEAAALTGLTVVGFFLGLL